MVEQNMRFLLAEDDDDHAELVIRSLQRKRPTDVIDRVTDGVEALAYLRRQDPYQTKPHPDLVLLDLNMPRMGGLEVLSNVKSDEKLRSIPVIILTTSAAETDRVKAYHDHVNSYIVKPLDFLRFQQMVHDICVYWGTWNKVPKL